MYDIPRTSDQYLLMYFYVPGFKRNQKSLIMFLAQLELSDEEKY